ncbi:MAG: hypothetical protein FJ267_16820, partial [Planctomycetes bacterium]|nr:hypothetical protein [Planctomycetota bacterium]
MLKVDTAAIHVNAVKSVFGDTITLSGAHPGQRVVADGVVDDRAKLEVGMRIYINGIDSGATIKTIGSNNTLATDLAIGAIASAGAGISFHERHESQLMFQQRYSTVNGVQQPLKASAWNSSTKTLTLDSYGLLRTDSNLLGYDIAQYTGEPPIVSALATGWKVIGQQINQSTGKTELTLSGAGTNFTIDSATKLFFYIPDMNYEAKSWNSTTNTLTLGNNDIGGAVNSSNEIANPGFDSSRSTLNNWTAASTGVDLLTRTLSGFSSIKMQDNGFTYPSASPTTTLTANSKISIVDAPIHTGIVNSTSTGVTISLGTGIPANDVKIGSRIYKNGIDTGAYVVALGSGSPPTSVVASTNVPVNLTDTISFFKKYETET